MVIRATRGPVQPLAMQGVPSILSYFKTLSIGLAPRMETATSRSAVKWTAQTIYSGTPPYGGLVITASFLRLLRPGKTAIHFLKKNR